MSNSVMIYRKNHHVSWIIRWKWILNLRSSENVPAYTLAANEGVVKETVNFTAMIQIWSFFVFLMIYVPILNSEGINFDWLYGWKCWTLAGVWTKVIQDLRNGGPLEMLSIAKPIKIKELLHQFLLLMLNLHYIFLFIVFLPDRGIAALPHYFGKCRTIISPRGP